jgi:hypothetical protein
VSHRAYEGVDEDIIGFKRDTSDDVTDSYVPIQQPGPVTEAPEGPRQNSASAFSTPLALIASTIGAGLKIIERFEESSKECLRGDFPF